MTNKTFGIVILTLALAMAGGWAVAPSAPIQDPPVDPEAEQVKVLLDEINRQQIEIEVLRQELAQAQLQAASAERELGELQQFIDDHAILGTAYEEYQGVREIAEREQRRKEAEAARERYEQIKAERRQRYEAARAARAVEKAEQERLDRYRDAGFSSLGLDVYSSRFSFYYTTKDTTHTRLDYRSGFGHYLRHYPNYDVDYSKMTISGSVLNASKQTRNIGVAITFFDENGVQVGHEIIQVNNARPDVPYPFTNTVELALDRPFASSSSYVLFADPIEGE